MSEFRSGRKSLSQYAWMAPAIVLLALGLAYLSGNGIPESSPSLQTLELGERHERVLILNPDRHQELLPWQPLASAIREQVLQNLSELRARYQMLGPTTTVAARPAAAELSQLAQSIGGLLTRHQLGHYVAEPQMADLVATDGNDSMYLHVASQDVALARNLLSALAPMLAGTVTIRFDERLASGQLRLVLAATPRFTGQGVAVFPRNEQ